jgi:hypothetical protein
VRKERPYPGAQLRITNVDGNRRVAFVTDSAGGQLADLELRHRRRARAKDRIRQARATGLRNLPLHGFTQNRVWCELVALACESVAWTQTLALVGEAKRWEIGKLRFRLLSAAARLICTGRRVVVRLPERWPWTRHVLDGIDRLGPLTAPTRRPNPNIPTGRDTPKDVEPDAHPTRHSGRRHTPKPNQRP